MSDQAFPRIPRARDVPIDLIKLDLLQAVTNLRNEILMFRIWKRAEFGFENAHLTTKSKSREIKFFIASVNDQLDYLLEIAKNLLRSTNDSENLEYKRFEDLARELIARAYIRPTRRQLTNKRNRLKINRT